MKRIMSIIMVAICVVSMVAMFAPTQASAASTTANIKDSTFVLLNEGAKNKALNNYAGNTSPGTKTTLWTFSKNDTDLWIRFIAQSGGGYKIFDHELKAVVVDVNRGTNKKIKPARGMRIDAWSDTKAENDYQIWIPERQSNGSYTLHLKAASNLVLGITKNQNGAQLQLVTYNKTDATQRWYICDTNGKKLTQSQIEGTSTTTSTPSGIPTSAYKKTGVVFTISSSKYYEAVTTRAYNGLASGSDFFVDAQGKVVTDTNTLQKLYSLVVFNGTRATQKSASELWVSVAQDYYAIYTNIAATEKMGEIIGKGSGALLSLGAGNSLTLKESLIELGDSVVSLDTLKAASLLGMVRYYTNNAIVNGNNAVAAMKSDVTDYDAMVYAVSSYADCAASFKAVDFLVGDQIKELSQSSTLKELGKYFDNVVVSFADSILPDLKAVEVTKAITDGVVSLSEMAVNSGAVSVHDKELTKQKAFLSESYNGAKSVADKLASGKNWSSLVGTTVASIKNSSGYTKWYGSGNISAKAGYDGECTWYALGRFYETTGIALKTAPHAKKWLSANKDDTRVKVLYGADKIVAGSIAVNTGGTYGHVMFIEHVEYENGKPVTVYFTECNYDANSSYNAGKDCILQKMSYSKFVSQRSPDGYIVAK